METSYIIIALLIIAIFYQTRSRSIFNKKIESFKQSQTAKLDNVDRHLHKLIREDKQEVHDGFRRMIALAGYAKMMISNEDNLVLVEDFNGKRFIADAKIKPLQFVPAKEVKVKKGVKVTTYGNKTYEFKAITDTDF